MSTGLNVRGTRRPSRQMVAASSFVATTSNMVSSMVPWCSTHQTADKQHAGLAPLEPVGFRRMLAGQHGGINACQLGLADGRRQAEVILVGLPSTGAHHHRLLAPLEAFEHQLQHGHGLGIVIGLGQVQRLALGVGADVPQESDLLAGFGYGVLALDVSAVIDGHPRREPGNRLPPLRELALAVLLVLAAAGGPLWGDDEGPAGEGRSREHGAGSRLYPIPFRVISGVSWFPLFQLEPGERQGHQTFPRGGAESGGDLCGGAFSANLAA